MEGIFFSYRRDDTAKDAGRIYERLANHFGDNIVFLDIEKIGLGEDFVDKINEALARAAYVLIAIGPRWLLVTDDKGRKRLDDPDDMVRYEIRSALQGRKRVVPMLIGGAEIPSAAELPADIKPLVRRNGIAIRPEPDFDMDVIALMEGLKPNRIVAGNIPVVFRVGLVAKNLGIGGGIGWGGSAAVLAMFADKAAALLILPIAGLLSGFAGGAFVGWLTGLLIRHRSPPLVGRKLVRMGFNWSMMLILSVVISGILGYFIAFHGMDSPSLDTAGRGFGEAIAAIFVGALLAAIVMLFVMVAIILAGFFTGSVIAATFFARQLRLRSDQISRWRGLTIALVWMLGGLLSGALFIGFVALLGSMNAT